MGLLNWIKNLYYDWKVDRALEGGTGVSSTEGILGTGVSTSNLEMSAIEQHDVERKYIESLITIKKKLKNKAKELGGYNQENLETILETYKSEEDVEWTEDLQRPDILDLSEQEKDAVKRFLYESKVYKGADVKSEDDKIKMIDKRIDHYRQLQVKRQIRQLNRQLRKAEQDGDELKSKELWSKINELSRELPGQLPSTRTKFPVL